MDLSANKSFVLHLDVSVYKSFELHLAVSTYAVPVGVQFAFFLFVSVCFETGVFLSKQRNKQKNLYFGFKQTEKQPIWFFSVQTENMFCLFRGHPSFRGTGDAIVRKG